jgi:hypothetical protein
MGKIHKYDYHCHGAEKQGEKRTELNEINSGGLQV